MGSLGMALGLFNVLLGSFILYLIYTSPTPMTGLMLFSGLLLGIGNLVWGVLTLMGAFGP